MMRWEERREDAGMRGKKSHVEKRNDARGKSAHEKIGYLKTDENGAMPCMMRRKKRRI